MKKEFPKFWFEGNLYFNWINSEEDLQKLFVAYEGSMTPDEILDKSKNQNYPDKGHDYTIYGLRSEHIHGDKTLREFLEENGVVLHKEFIPALFKYHHHGQLADFDFEPSEEKVEILYKEADVVKLLKKAIACGTRVGFTFGIHAKDEEKAMFFIEDKKFIDIAIQNFINTEGKEYSELLKEYNDTIK